VSSCIPTSPSMTFRGDVHRPGAHRPLVEQIQPFVPVHLGEEVTTVQRQKMAGYTW